MVRSALDREIAQQFDRALAIAADARRKLAESRSNPFEYAAARDAALAPFDAACARLHGEFEAARGAEWESAAAAAWLRASHVLQPLLSERENGPRLLTGRTVLVERDGGLLLDLEGPASAPEGRVPPDCCITSILLRNITGVRTRLTLTHENGATKTAEFAPDQVRRVTFRERAGDDEDDRPVGPPIPGGMGHCVTIKVEVRDGARWVQVMTKRLCCDDQPPLRDGSVIEEVRSVGGSPEHFARYSAFRIVHIDIARPCPNLAPAAPAQSTHGTADSQASHFEGHETEPGKYQYGAGCWLRFIPDGCRSFCFVQGVRRRVFIRPPGGKEKAAPLLGTPGNDLKLDIRPGDRTPCYPHTSDIAGGGKVLRDFPGVSNPWAPVQIDGKSAGRLASGTQLRIEWTFRTWVVCLDGPVHVLGHFDWTMQVDIRIGDGRNDTTARITPPSPVWSDDPDRGGYNKVAGQAPEHGGFHAP
ncbi:MAG: hypothetical protein ACM3YM_11660 [Sphingomonadales bacterium]